jgi:hypothetical protein
MERLTDRCVKSLTPRGSAYEVREGDGFGVRVQHHAAGRAPAD